MSSMTITAKFIQAFDPSNKIHVTWFKRMTDLAEEMGDPNKAITLVKEVNSNPMKLKLEDRDALDWFHIHFVLCGAYARAVLNGTAYIPSSDTS